MIDKDILNTSNFIIEAIEGSLKIGEEWQANLNKELISVTTRLINKQFDDNNNKIDYICKQAYITGQLEEIQKRKNELRKLLVWITGLDNKLNELNKSKE